MNNLKLLVGKNGTFYDYTELLIRVVWSGRKGAAPRTVEATLFDSEQEPKARAKINCGDGLTCILYEKGKELFRGLVMTENYSSKRTLKIKAYDNCIRLCNNKDSFSFKEKRADEIFRECLKRLGLKAGTVVNTGHVIGELVKKNTTFWDVIEDALSQTYKNTGKRYYVSASKGKISLKRRVEQKTMVMLELNTNISSYDSNRSIYDTRTRLKLTTSKGETKGSTVNSSLEKKIGRFQEVESVDEDITSTEVKQRIKIFNEEQSIVSRSLKVTATGDASVISGGCVYASISNLGTKRVMYVDEDTHTWEKGHHMMVLKLNYAKDIDRAG